MLKTIWELLKETFNEWREDEVSHHAASLAFYALFSIVPLLILLISVAGIFLGRQQVRSQVITQIQDLTSDTVANIVENVLQVTYQQPNSNALTVLLGLVVLIIWGSAMFYHLQTALNYIWDVHAEVDRSGPLSWLKNRFFSLVLLLSVFLVIMLALVINAVLPRALRLIGDLSPGVSLRLQIANILISLSLVALSIALIFKYLADVEIAWKDVGVGAVFTTVLLLLGQFVIEFYLRASNFVSAYSVAGSLLAFLLWVYYSAQIVLIGAEFTKAYARLHGEEIHPRENALATASSEAA